jgi:hypothetical protein
MARLCAHPAAYPGPGPGAERTAVSQSRLAATVHGSEAHSSLVSAREKAGLYGPASSYRCDQCRLLLRVDYDRTATESVLRRVAVRERLHEGDDGGLLLSGQAQIAQLVNVHVLSDLRRGPAVRGQGLRLSV